MTHTNTYYHESMTPHSPGGCRVCAGSTESLRVCAGLMGVDPAHLNQALLSRVMQTSKGGLKGTVIM